MERATVYLETKPTLGWSRSTGRRMPEGVVELAWRGTTPVAAVQLSTIVNLALRTSYCSLLQLTVACRSVGAAGLAEGEDVPTKVVRLFAGRV